MQFTRRNLFKTSAVALSATAVTNIISTDAFTSEAAFKPSKETPLLLNFNENSLGMSPKAKAAVAKSLAEAFRYPDAARAGVIEKIASYLNVKSENITLGNGSSEVIQAAVQALIVKAQKAGKPVQLLEPVPTFNYAEIYSKAMNIPVVNVPIKGNGEMDIGSLKKAENNFRGHTIVYLCNPNNPTARILDSKTLNTWIKTAKSTTFFIIDEAYAEFVTDKNFQSCVELVKKGQKNVIVARTFSKLFAMAALRFGYGVATKETAALIDGFQSIDNTNLAGAVAGIESLDDKNFQDLSLLSNQAAKKIVMDAFDELGIKYMPCEANFIFHQIKGNHQVYKDRMAAAHVFVGRAFPPFEHYNRLTIGTPEEMKAFVKVLKDFRKKGWI